MSRIIFNLAAKTDAAGRPNSKNQDNCWVCPDLTHWDASNDKLIGTDEDVELSDKGALLVVADGMGGMNAGEVASELVIKGIKKKFSNIPDSILTDENLIQTFIREAIVEADESIKNYAKEHKDAEGLGSTIVLLWLLNGRAFCGWCGDSRIYRFNPNNELVRLSHDHSYVQSLVDEGKISEEEAFDHPDGNIIIRSLGDNGSKANPELKVYDVYQRDVFLLCSDGLCGLLQDSEISEIIEATCTSSKDTLHGLWKKGEETGWSDNATIDILCIVDGGKPAKGRPDGYPKLAQKPIDKKDGSNKPMLVSDGDNIFAKILRPPYLYILLFVALCLLGLALYNVFGAKGGDENTNHEFNIEVPENGGNTTDVSTINNGAANVTNSQGGTGSVTNNSGNANANIGGNNRPTRQTGSQENPVPNQNHNGQPQNSNGGNNNTQQNANNGGINQGVIEQLNGNSSNSNGVQSSQSTEVYPSQGYLDLLRTVQRDYNNAKSAFATVKNQRWRTRSTDNTIEHYMNNIDNNLKSLRSDSKNYNALDNNQKELINAFTRLADDIDRIYFKYPAAPPREGLDENPDGDDSFYGGGRSF